LRRAHRPQALIRRKVLQSAPPERRAWVVQLGELNQLPHFEARALEIEHRLGLAIAVEIHGCAAVFLRDDTDDDAALRRLPFAGSAVVVTSGHGSPHWEPQEILQVRDDGLVEFDAHGAEFFGLVNGVLDRMLECAR
jgi:hypothetical protein